MRQGPWGKDSSAAEPAGPTSQAPRTGMGDFAKPKGVVLEENLRAPHPFCTLPAPNSPSQCLVRPRIGPDRSGRGSPKGSSVVGLCGSVCGEAFTAWGLLLRILGTARGERRLPEIIDVKQSQSEMAGVSRQ